MPDRRPFNPLDKGNLGLSVADALVAEAAAPLADIKPFKGAGIYAIYFQGNFAPYAALIDKDNEARTPIYVGKAVPAGARKGGFALDIEAGQVLFRRLREHADTIRQVESHTKKKGLGTQIKLENFSCRYLLVDDIWIPLGESMMIARFQPAWNIVVDGFGNHDPGGGRYRQQRSAWDTIHPGRSWAQKCQPYSRNGEWIFEDLKNHFASKK